MDKLHSRYKQEVQSFYDTVGWEKTVDYLFTDATLFEDLRPVSYDYRHNCHLRLNDYLSSIGIRCLAKLECSFPNNVHSSPILRRKNAQNK